MSMDQPKKRTPAKAGTKAGVKKIGNRETSVNLNSTNRRSIAITHYTVDAYLRVEVQS